MVSVMDVASTEVAQRRGGGGPALHLQEMRRILLSGQGREGHCRLSVTGKDMAVCMKWHGERAGLERALLV